MVTNNCFTKPGDRLDIIINISKDDHDETQLNQSILAICNGINIAKQQYDFHECDDLMSIEDCLYNNLNNNLIYHLRDVDNRDLSTIEIDLDGLYLLIDY